MLEFSTQVATNLSTSLVTSVLGIRYVEVRCSIRILFSCFQLQVFDHVEASINDECFRKNAGDRSKFLSCWKESFALKCAISVVATAFLETLNKFVLLAGSITHHHSLIR